MSTSPPPYETPRTPLSLAKLAAILAAAFCIAFGLCTVSATTLVGTYQKTATAFIWISVITEILCFLGLIIIGLMAIVRASRRP
jgi:hypothetical protein